MEPPSLLCTFCCSHHTCCMLLHFLRLVWVHLVLFCMFLRTQLTLSIEFRHVQLTFPLIYQIYMSILSTHIYTSICTSIYFSYTYKIYGLDPLFLLLFNVFDSVQLRTLREGIRTLLATAAATTRVFFSICAHSRQYDEPKEGHGSHEGHSQMLGNDAKR